VAQHIAADHPELVRRLVLHSTAHSLGPEGRRMQLRLAELARQGHWRSAYAVSLRFMLPRHGVRRFALAPATWIVSMLAGSLGTPRDPSDLVVTIEAEDAHHFSSRLSEISAPSLVVAGADDPFYTRRLFEETAAGIPDAQLILYEGMGHPAHGAQFARDVRIFFSRQPRSPGRDSDPEALDRRHDGALPSAGTVRSR
jgi:pimeloyl-ACP methyl ester carboxylesterase